MTKKKPKTGGRKKGTPNKMTVGVKAALGEAFDRLGGVEALVSWGRRNRTHFYRLWVKTLPQEIKAEHSGPGGKPIQYEHTNDEARALSDDELAAEIAAARSRVAAAGGGAAGPAGGGAEPPAGGAGPGPAQ